MSYLVLARKYRPRNFTEMVGQEHVVQALTNALNTQRLHHAYLFTGTRGVGKTTVSRILAKSLNCQGPDGQGGITATPCGVCSACTDIDSGRFPDYTELDAASNRGVDEVQSLLEQAVYKPVQGRFKVFMIDEVHMLTNTAFNAMLKTLEEPPEYLKFVLATTDPQKVPVTVLSRCLQFNLRPMAPETVLSHLTQVLASENVSSEPQALRLLSRAARGSMRDALSLTDQAIAFGSGQLQEAAVRQMLGAVDRSYVFRLIGALAEGDGKTVVETSDTLRLNGLSAASTLEEMSAVLQRMAVFQAVPQMAGAVDTDDPEAAETARLAALMPADETQLLYSLCLHGRGELGLAPDEYAALTMVLLRLLAFKPVSGVGGVGESAEKKTLTRAEAALLGPPAAVSAAPAAAAVAVPAVPAPVARTAVAPAPVLSVPPAVPAAAIAAGVSPVLAPEVSAEAAEPVDSSEPPPWPGSEAPGAGSPANSAATALPVRTPERFGQNQHPAQFQKAQGAPEYVAIPVRESPEPGERLQPLPLSAPTPVSARYTPTEEGDVWHATVQQMVAAESITALVRELALQSQLVARDGGHWLLRVERESLNQPTARERLRAALEAAGHATQISVEVGHVIDSPARRNAAAAAERQRRAEEIVNNDPYVQSLVRDYGARIVPGSIKPA
ncbi:DNA polymerase III subunit gamma/tau [Acidovorax sp. SD340]|uniref:DNA polymerase III subunit gamma/tau n=1 Tax=Acidovorax sp. SD340 TaxID=1690268 RepID=UPI0006DCE37F|nr:DNA polymerase III subunit gamma/tau [Acidovorax sp. SD340]KQB58567.1 DNA polymerase III subunit gamma/tau [Acidovorax sp. SD340]MBO1008113.1 DNA polymerase III subunit gamma/tau [Acidovorax sp. SD340]